MDAKTHWDEVHADRDAGEVSWYLPQPERALRLLEDAGVEPEARILDVGCGVSGLAEPLLDRGYRHVIAVDISPVAIQRARERLGPRSDRVTYIVADVRDLRLPEPVDVWHDRAVLHFLTEPADQAAYVESLRRNLAPRGHVLLATFALDGPEQCSGIPVERYDADGLARLLGDEFEMQEMAREVHVTPWDAEQAFTWARFQRRS